MRLKVVTLSAAILVAIFLWTHPTVAQEIVYPSEMFGKCNRACWMEDDDQCQYCCHGVARVFEDLCWEQYPDELTMCFDAIHYEYMNCQTVCRHNSCPMFA